jgi:hypothetical protein
VPITDRGRHSSVALAVQLLTSVHGLGQLMSHSRLPATGVQEATGDQAVQVVWHRRATSTV